MKVCHHHALALLLPEPQEQMLEEVRHLQYHQGWKYQDGEDIVVVGVDSRTLEMPFYLQEIWDGLQVADCFRGQ